MTKDTLTFGVISDTHGVLPSEVFDIFEGVRAIFHCGDICNPDIIIDLEMIAPVYAVSGNMDPHEIAATQPTRRRAEIDGRRFALVHGHLFPQPPERNVVRILKAFGEPLPHVLLFGHTHVWHWKRLENVWVLNPGSAVQPRDGAAPTVCLLTHESATDTWSAEKVDLKKKR